MLYVIYDIKIFLLILLILYLASGEGFLRLSETSDTPFIKDFGHALLYSFNASLGGIETDNFDSTVIPFAIWLLYVLTMVYISIIMLNLLISIISDSFNRINSNAEASNYQEKASMISENEYLIPHRRKVAYSPLGHYLVKAHEIVIDLEKSKTVHAA